MKKENFILTVSLLAFIFQACQSEESIKIPEGELRVVQFSSGAKEAENGKKIIFTENDIESFHIKTREIVFYHLTSEDLEKRIGGNESVLTYYIGDEILFSSIFVIPPISSAIYNNLSLVTINSKCYLLDGYPSLDIIGYNKDEHTELRKKNIKKNQQSWDIWIKHLEEKGKVRK